MPSPWVACVDLPPSPRRHPQATASGSALHVHNPPSTILPHPRPRAPQSSSPNDLLNIRSVLPDGSCILSGAGAPWAPSWKGPEVVIFGHDAVRGLQRTPLAIGLDTGCVYGNRLTALHWPGGTWRLGGVSFESAWHSHTKGGFGVCVCGGPGGGVSGRCRPCSNASIPHYPAPCTLHRCSAALLHRCTLPTVLQ